MDIPQSPGRAAATDRFMAQGGTRVNRNGKGFVYQKGPMKGKTYDQAMQMASDRWAKASPEIRDKYAARASAAMLAPSELAAFEKQQASDGYASNLHTPRFGEGPGVISPKDAANAAWAQTYQDLQKRSAAQTSQTANPTPGVPKLTDQQKRMKMYADQQSARMGREGPLSQALKQQPSPGVAGGVGQAGAASGGRAGQLLSNVQQPAPRVAPTFAELTKAPAAPVGGVKSIGDGSTAENGWTPTRSTPLKAPAAKMEEQTPVGRALGGIVDANTRLWEKVTRGVNGAVAAPFTVDSQRMVNEEMNAADEANKARSAAAADAARSQVTAENANRLRAEKGLPTVSTEGPSVAAPPAVARPSPQVPSMVYDPAAAAAYAGPTVPSKLSPLAQGELAKRKAAVGGTPAGKAVLNVGDTTIAASKTGGSVNRLTGLPVGWQPGDALPGGADAGMAERAAQSAKRQEVATSKAAYAGPGVPKATIAPAPVRYADEQSRYQSGGLDPRRTANMDSIYKGASSVDQAKITANSLKRASSGYAGPAAVFQSPKPAAGRW